MSHSPTLYLMSDMEEKAVNPCRLFHIMEQTADFYITLDTPTFIIVAEDLRGEQGVRGSQAITGVQAVAGGQVAG